MKRSWSVLRRRWCAMLPLACVVAVVQGAQPSASQVDELIEQNRRLQAEVRAQQQTIDALQAKVGELSKESARHERELRGLADRAEAPSAMPSTSSRDHEVRISAETGVAFFNTGRSGQFPKAEFRVDDPVVAIEAPVAKNVYFFGELKLQTRESSTEGFQLGELYVDFEDVSRAWGQPGLLSVRAGRLNIPFGEEYLLRSPVANPLISHSLADIWGVDEGVEVYGRIGPASYVVAVQNGGESQLHDYTADKSVTARVGWQPLRWLHVSGSALRTGRLATVADNLSEVWFANSFFRAIGPANRTSAFWANLYQLDALARWSSGHVSAALGRARYDDSDTGADNSRNFRFGHVEAVQTLTGGLFAAARYSRIGVDRGYPMAGWGPLGTFFFRPLFTERLQRTSVGLGYRFGPPLVLKVEYTWETGRLTTGVKRDSEDFFGTEVGVKF